MIDAFPKAHLHIDTAMSIITEWKEAGEQLVFTNGCFDLLHIGHISYLKEAQSLGSKLIVGVNSDASVRHLKGQHRPIKDEINRLAILSSLDMVDLCIRFDAETPYELIQSIRPHILVKGGDWSPQQIVGSDIVLGDGGIVRSLTFLEGYSTTALEEKIKQS